MTQLHIHILIGYFFKKGCLVVTGLAYDIHKWVITIFIAMLFDIAVRKLVHVLPWSREIF